VNRPCVSSKTRLQVVVGATVGSEKGLEPSKGVDADTAPGGLIMPKRAGKAGRPDSTKGFCETLYLSAGHH